MSPTPSPQKALTPRQLEVLELMAKGLTNGEIGSVLHISVGTAKNHVSAVLDALDVTNRTEAAVVLESLRTTASPETNPVPGFGERPAIAVLPFQNLSGDAEQDLLAAGIVEDLTTALAAFRWFPVISRTSSSLVMQAVMDGAMEGAGSVAEVGEKLGARYVIEGSTQRAGNRVRIHVQLIDVRNDEHLLAQRFDRTLDDVLSTQDEIVTGVVGALEPALLRAEGQRVRSVPAESLGVWERFQRGIALTEVHTPEALDEAVACFDSAIADEPEYAPPHAGKALALHLRALFHIGATSVKRSSPEEIREGRELARTARRLAVASARQATRLDPQDARGWVGLGLSLPGTSEREQARSVLERAVDLNPSSAMACWALASQLVNSDELDPAQALFERAIRLSPRDAYLHHFEGGLAGVHFQMERDAETLVHVRRSVDVQPNDRSTYRPLMAAALAHAGRLDEARAELAYLRGLHPDWNLALERSITPARFFERLVEGFYLAGWDLRADLEFGDD